MSAPIHHHLAPGASIYMDAHATERPRPEAVEAMLPYLSEAFGNPSATSNQRGLAARRAVEQARSTIAEAVGGHSDRTIFTGGATEANNLVVSGQEGAVAASAFEHKCVLEPARRLGPGRLRLVAPDRDGRISPQAVDEALFSGVSLVSVMAANNEIGALAPIADIAEVCRRRGALLHCDAAQALGKIPLDLAGLGVDFLTLSAHKVGGPGGIGALVCSEAGWEALRPQLLGGGQEQGRRAGTLSPALCAGFERAVELACADVEGEAQRLAGLRGRLLQGLQATGRYVLNGGLEHRLPNNLNGRFVGLNAQRLLAEIPQLHCSVGSACTTGAGPSHVLQSIGLSDEAIAGSFRLGLSWSTREQDVDDALHLFGAAVAALASQ